MLLPHRELALGMVLRATGNLAEAEDCVHDAMLRLVRRSDLDPARVRARLGISYKSVEGSYTRGRALIRHLIAVVVAGLVDRLRRAASPGGEMAATTVAALLLLGGPGAGGAAAGEQPTALPPGGAHRPIP